jgi:hypothetical protein
MCAYASPIRATISKARLRCETAASERPDISASTPEDKSGREVREDRERATRTGTSGAGKDEATGADGAEDGTGAEEAADDEAEDEVGTDEEGEEGEEGEEEAARV